MEPEASSSQCHVMSLRGVVVEWDEWWSDGCLSVSWLVFVGSQHTFNYEHFLCFQNFNIYIAEMSCCLPPVEWIGNRATPPTPTHRNNATDDA